MPLLFVLAVAAQAAAAPVTTPVTTPVDRVTCSAPVTIARLDSRKLDGRIVRMAWSPDGTKLYLQTASSDNGVAHHYLLVVDGHGKPERLDVEPTWASQFWSLKSSPVSPGSGSFKIDVESHQQMLHSTTVSMGGALALGASGGSGTTVNDVTTAIRGQQLVTITQLQAAGRTIGTWTDENVDPGFTFGWAPASVGLLAYVDRRHDGRLVLLDAAGHTRELRDTKHAILPAWSNDGAHLAYLQRDGRDKYSLRIIRVTVRS